ncbi:Conserved oligomeric Golgi complex subunit 1-like [Oopsacas minuta]|uniref:Conserved oligomeric Golgi complex subunit 1 n=1 Tax=Oopsacas minuta TaxID=111878 RepID=A0AAV7JYR1_9METZ|nr:Conserved oligomeric Golgi complex subunit 1-like [Oopsacas minuta]
MNQTDAVSIANEIFQKKSLVEIRAIEAKLRSQVKEKREDLRQTVGEQYRNVIDSGENVSIMQNNCMNIKNSLTNLTQRLNTNLKDTLKRDCTPSYNTGSQECEYSQGLAQLYNTPSGIWSALANGKFFKATILYVKSRQFISKFKLLDLDSEYARSLFITSPVLCDHVRISHSLETSVLTYTINGLGRAQNPESLTENLIALQIMRNCTTEEIFRDFLHSRRNALWGVFDMPEQGPPLTTRQQLTEISQLLISTLYDIKCIFFPNKSNNEILIHLIKNKMCVNEDIFHLLDNSEANMKFIQTELKSWIENVEHGLKPKIAESLVFVTTTKGLTSIRDFILESLNQFIREINRDSFGENPISESHDFLKILCIEVIGESKDIWEIFIGNPLLAKMENLLCENFHEVVSRFSSSLDECIGNVSSLELRDFSNSEVNLANFLWNFNENSEQKTKNLISQVLGCTPNITKLCQILDDLLESLQNEIHNFITPNQTRKLAFSLPDYSNKISHLLQSNCSHALSSIITLISDKIAKLSDSYYKLYLDSVPTQNTLNTLVFLGRLGVNIRENCKVLESILERKESDQWKANKTKLIESMRPAFGPWIHQIVNRTSEFLSSSLEEFTELSHLSLFTSEWPEVIIEEEREDGQKHETSTCLPTRPSPILYQTIFIICQEIHRIVLSDQIVLQQLSDAVINKFIEIYKKYIENSKKRFHIPQNLSLQLLFDVKWLLNVIPHCETTPAINRDINTVLVLIEDAIDPFDLDVYKPYIHTAIQTQLQLNSVLFGSFTSLIRKQIPKQQQLTPQAPHFESKIHNIIPLAPNISRFILLPVSSTQKPDNQTKNKLSNTKIDSSSSNINYIDSELQFFANFIKNSL